MGIPVPHRGDIGTARPRGRGGWSGSEAHIQPDDTAAAATATATAATAAMATAAATPAAYAAPTARMF
ncbi:uncharacterized protein OCT59_020900 [Rhizophagus irregularis]|uniref:uncharacterized protein n=1 Tax=Rhizophagus irregularis TaxID=588596 RepID=UPI000CCA0D80|nr:hypothetical protein OCT59_020900 [Rhizophagus irregularis]